MRLILAIVFVVVAWLFGPWIGLAALFVALWGLVGWPGLELVRLVAILGLRVTGVAAVIGAVWYFLGWIPGVIALFIAMLVLIGLPEGSSTEMDGGCPSNTPPDYGFPDQGPSSHDAGDMTAG